MKLYIMKHLALLFFAFVFAYKFKAYYDEQTGVYKKILMPFVYTLFGMGFIYDIFVNYLLTVTFLDLPKSWFETVTNRMKRYKTRRDGSFKYIFSVKLCEILNKYDPEHC